MKRYIKKLNTELSILGFGLMRLPMNGDNWFDTKVFDLIRKSIELGVNYFDTGYYYQNERSEELIREALVKRIEREKFYIADKLPVWDCHSRDDMERILKIQLERLGVEYIDFYLLHALHKMRWKDIYEKGVLDFLEDKKKKGIIKHVGFSFHDSAENMKTVIESYDWDFAQIQLNYYDWEVLNTKENYYMLLEKNIPCITMESVGGGRLSVLPPDAEQVFSAIHPDWSSSAWAMHFVSSLPNVAVVLSGMNSKKQLEDNIRNCNQSYLLEEDEKNAIYKVVNILRSKKSIPCTSCRYCVSECLQKIDIPQVFKAYNDYMIFDSPYFFDIAYNLLAGYPRAENCIGCGKCMTKCPQRIDIPGQMKKIQSIAVEREMGIGRIDTDFIVCFGCGDYGKRVFSYLESAKVNTILFSDNNSNLWGQLFCGCRVIEPSVINKLIEKNKGKIIITTQRYYHEVLKQIIKMGIAKDQILNK